VYPKNHPISSFWRSMIKRSPKNNNVQQNSLNIHHTEVLFWNSLLHNVKNACLYRLIISRRNLTLVTNKYLWLM